MVLSDPEPVARAKPVEAMIACPPELPLLPDDFAGQSLEEAIETVLSIHVLDADAYFTCRRKHRALVEWINGER